MVLLMVLITYNSYNLITESTYGRTIGQCLIVLLGKSISENHKAITFLIIETKEIYQIIKISATQFKTPKYVDSLSQDEIKEIMNINNDFRKFLILERHKLHTELIKIKGESIQEIVVRITTKANTCYFASIKDTLNEALKTAFYAFFTMNQCSRAYSIALPTN